MRRIHKNAIFNYIIRKNNDFGGLKLDFNENDAIVNYIPSEGTMNFQIVQSTKDFDRFFCKGSTYAPKFPQELFSDGLVLIDYAIDLLDLWVYNHATKFKDDLEEPDLFEEYTRGVNMSSISVIDYSNADVFTIEEEEHIRLGFHELKLLIANNYSQNSQQVGLVNERIDYMIEAMQRLNKTDWKSIFVSTVIGIITTLSLDTERGNELLKLFITILHVVPTLFSQTSF